MDLLGLAIGELGQLMEDDVNDRVYWVTKPERVRQ